MFELTLTPALFPFRDGSKDVKINSITFLARCSDDGNYRVTLTPPLHAPPPADFNALTLSKSKTYGGLHFAEKDVSGAAVTMHPDDDPPTTWRITMKRPGGGNLGEDPVHHTPEVSDALVVLGYQWE